MQAFRTLTAIAAPLRRLNVDTDAISPGSQLLKVAVTKEGYGACLFYNWRHREDGTEEPDFVLNKEPYRHAKILLAGHNFACGSSREVAVWALRDYGFRCVIAPSFGNIFYSNMFKNGLLPVVIGEDDVEAICDEVDASDGTGETAQPSGLSPSSGPSDHLLPEAGEGNVVRPRAAGPGMVTVDLEANRVVSPSGKTFAFRIPEIYRQALLDGLDPISATLRFVDDIAAFQAQDRRRRAWAYFGGPGISRESFEQGKPC
jgi:3-isopropylmalate/(R)-2-methylmalate dehydratase small subunit